MTLSAAGVRLQSPCSVLKSVNNVKVELLFRRDIVVAQVPLWFSVP